MRFFRAPAVALLCLCASTSHTHAQQVVLSQINFVGDPAHTQAELLAYSGLKAGNSTQQEVQDAAQRLGDSGLFEDVNFASNGTILTYTLKPAPANTMLPVRFSNFVWWDDKDLTAALQARVPLYHGGPVPLSGNVRDSIATALKGIVAEKGVPDPSVASRPSASRIGGPVDTIDFSIESPWVLIHTLTLAHASPALQPKLQRVITDEMGQQWDQNAALPDIASRLGDVYRNEGYLDIAVTKLDRSAPVINAHSIDVDLTATLSEGQQYHVSRLTWPGSEIMSSADFIKQSPLKPGDPASPTVLRTALHILSTAYSTKGYIEADVAAPPQIDRTQHLVAYTVSVQPGPQYRFKSIRWIGVPDVQRQDLDFAWREKPGDIFDATYPTRFMVQTAQPLMRGYKVSVLQRTNPADHTVDLTVSFTPPAPPR
jgi:outer membrane protein assembly factor BamA